MNVIDVERLGRNEEKERRFSVRAASEKKVASRQTALMASLRDPIAMQHHAAELRQQTMDDLGSYLREAAEKLENNGVQVHWAENAEQANAIIGDICKVNAAKTIVKSKSMVTEEIHLNDYLKSLGFSPVETDLGEFVVQIDGDHPSHIVTPIIHKNRFDVARSFEREGLGEYTEDPEELTMQARRHLRKAFTAADLGITGANFVVAETGRMVTVSNEGNLRWCSTSPRVHIAITGIEKIVAREIDLAVILKLMARSATGQNLTVYTQFIAGPRREGELDGPDEVHLVFLDNGRTNLLGGKYHEMLRCIRCGACLNVCPVYRQVTGHGYGSIYPGPMGAVYSPLLGGELSWKKYAHLPKASSLCAACEEVCPVSIPIPKMLLALRDEMNRSNAPKPDGQPSFAMFSRAATSPLIWKAGLRGGKIFGWKPASLLPLPALTRWKKERELPQWPRESFREWWKNRERLRS